MEKQVEQLSPWEALPVEIFAEIFSHFSLVQLKRVRLTCRRWNLVVCETPALMSQFLPVFGYSSVLAKVDHDEQAKMAANVTGRYSTAYVELAQPFPKGGSPIWAKVGVTLQSLTVDVWGAIDLFIELLRMTPNLKRLIVKNSIPNLHQEEARTVDFKLEQLVELNFNGEFVDIFRQLCPNLRVLIQRRPNVVGDEVNILPLIRTTYTTLQNLSLTDTNLQGDTFREICSFDQLHLKELSLTGSWQDSQTKIESVLTLLSKQSSLKVLKFQPIETTDGFDQQIWQNMKEKLPHLKSLFLTIGPSHLTDLPTFLRGMSGMESLDLTLRCKSNDVLYLRPIATRNLTGLTLDHAKLDNDDLTAFFKISSNIRNLAFNSVSVFILSAISSLKQLENLEVYWCDNFLSGSFLFFGIHKSDLSVLSSVKILKYYHWNPVPTYLLVEFFPNVENLTIDCLLTNNDVLVLVQELNQLKHLQLPPCKTITEAALDHIIEHGHSMESLIIKLKASDINKLKLSRLEKTVRVRVIEVPYYESRYADSD